MRIFFMRDVFRDDYVHIYSTIFTKEYASEIPKQIENPMFLHMGFVKCHLTLKFGSMSFRITQTNKPRVDRFFSEVDGWFRDSTMPDLFIYNAKDRLEFNPKYSKLKRVVYSGNDTHQFMEAFPAVITNDADKDVEGVILNIDNKSNTTLLTIDELDSICDIVKDFNFQSEILMGYMRYITMPRELKNMSKLDKPRYGDNKNANNPFLK